MAASTVGSATDKNRRRNDDVIDPQQQRQQQQQQQQQHVRLRRVQSAGATCQSSRDHTSRDHSSRGHSTETQTARDVDAVSKLVSRKLELYLNDVRREEGFDPTGGRRVSQTTSRGTVDFGGRVPEKCTSAHRTSREDDHIRQVATSLLDTRATSSIDVIHQVRPFSATCTPLNVQNFRLHFGTVLNIDKYLEYYKQQGLSGGATERNKRHHKQLLKLRHAAKTEKSSKTQQEAATQDTQTCEVYTLTTPRYLESSWDVAASVRHQMRSFSVDEIRKLRQRPADESYPVKVCVDVDDDNEQQQQQSQRQTTDMTPRHHNRSRPSPGTHHYYDNDVDTSVTSPSPDRDGDDEELDPYKIFSLDNNNHDVSDELQQPMYYSPYDDDI